MTPKPYAESCAENQDVILEQLTRLFAACRSVLEIGSGSGQHAVHFGRNLPHLVWQTSERRELHAGIQLWLDEAALPNVKPPLVLDVARDTWPAGPYDAAFSANTAHIMSWPEVQAMFMGIGRVLAPHGLFVLYGPFHYHGRATAESNARFDAWLRARDPACGVRDVDHLEPLAARAGLAPQEDIAMPVNNRILVWRVLSTGG